MSGILEKDGSTSSMRIAMLTCVATACVVSLAVVYGSLTSKPVDSNIPWLVGVLLSTGFGGKVMQKKTEA